MCHRFPPQAEPVPVAAHCRPRIAKQPAVVLVVWLAARRVLREDAGLPRRVWLVSPDGRHRRLLKSNPLSASSPPEELSPDGGRLVVLSGSAKGSALGIESLTGHVLRTLRRWAASSTTTVEAVSWSSHDEIMFLEQSFNDNPDKPCAAQPPSRLLAMSASGGRARLIAGVVSSPDWAPGGNAVAYVRDVRTGSPSARLADVECPTPPPSISNLYGSDRVGRHERRVTRVAATNPVWSPRGTRFAFRGATPGSRTGTCFTPPFGAGSCFSDTSVYLIGSRGGTPRLLIANATSPLWQP